MLKAISTVILTAVFSALFTLGAVSWYLWQYNPYNIKACVISSFLNNSRIQTDKAEGESATSSATILDKNPLLSPEQENMLEKAGINVSTLPNGISSTMQACFEEKLGKERVSEIIKGDIPGPLELFKVKACL